MSKLLFTIVLLLTLSIRSFSQQTKQVQEFTKTDYLNKSKHQKHAANALLWGGLGVVIIGGVIDYGANYDGIFRNDRNSTTGSVIAYVGAASIVGSIPLFIASSKNKKKANQVAVLLKTEKFTGFRYQSFKQNFFPALSIKVSL